MGWTNLRKRKRSDDDDGDGDGGLEAEVRARNACGRNSSKQMPGKTYRFNEEQREVPCCLLALPDDVLGRIFSYVLIKDEPIVVTKNTMDLSEELAEVKDSRGRTDIVPLERIALLGTCVRFRELSRPIFYAGNDFVVAVESFNATASTAWWNKVNNIRQLEAQVQTPRVITLESRHVPRPRLLFAGYRKPTMSSWIQQYHHTVTTARDAAPLTSGHISFDIDYVPNWVNLKYWLHAYYKDELPPYTIMTANAPTHLQGIAIAFNSIKAFLHWEWVDVAAQSLVNIRANLIIQDYRWEARSSRAQVVEIKEDEDSENIQEIGEDGVAAAMSAAKLEDDQACTSEALEESTAPSALDTRIEELAAELPDIEGRYLLHDRENEDEEEGEENEFKDKRDASNPHDEPSKPLASQCYEASESAPPFEDDDDSDERTAMPPVEDDEDDEDGMPVPPGYNGTPSCGKAAARASAQAQMSPPTSTSSYVGPRERLSSSFRKPSGSGTATDRLDVDDEDEED